MSDLKEAIDHAIETEGLVQKWHAYERAMSADPNARKQAFEHLIEMPGQRYLFLSKGSVPILDGRHFFAAMCQELSGEMYFAITGHDGNRINTLLLGIGNELNQCVQETMTKRFNSCFSPEDLGTNRMGYEFAQLVRSSQLAQRPFQTTDLLRSYLGRFGPLSISELHRATQASGLDTVNELNQVPPELLRLLLRNLWEFIVPSAY